MGPGRPAAKSRLVAAKVGLATRPGRLVARPMGLEVIAAGRPSTGRPPATARPEAVVVGLPPAGLAVGVLDPVDAKAVTASRLVLAFL